MATLKTLNGHTFDATKVNGKDPGEYAQKVDNVTASSGNVALGAVRYNAAQSLSAAEKTRAVNNIGAVPASRTINGINLSGNVTLGWATVVGGQADTTLDNTTGSENYWGFERTVTAIADRVSSLGIRFFANSAELIRRNPGDTSYRAHKIYDEANKPTPAEIGAVPTSRKINGVTLVNDLAIDELRRTVDGFKVELRGDENKYTLNSITGAGKLRGTTFFDSSTGALTMYYGYTDEDQTNHSTANFYSNAYPPPYPVKSVNGLTGVVNIAEKLFNSDVSVSPGGTISLAKPINKAKLFIIQTSMGCFIANGPVFIAGGAMGRVTLIKSSEGNPQFLAYCLRFKTVTDKNNVISRQTFIYEGSTTVQLTNGLVPIVRENNTSTLKLISSGSFVFY